MFIESVDISNFRGLTVKVDDLKDNFLIIGRNDSGKSNFCYAIRKILEYDTRKKSLDKSDSSNFNGENIIISLKINLDDITNEQLNILGSLSDYEEDGKFVYVTLEAIYNKDTMYYEENLIFGHYDKMKYATNVTNPLDKILNLIYIYPAYDFEREKRKFFIKRQQSSITENTTIDEDVKESVNKLNETIQQNEYFNNLKNEINSQDGFEEIFEEVKFLIKSDIHINNIYKSLDILPFVNNGENEINIGDGKNKTISMLLNVLSYSDDKNKIIIIEEPENHMYPLLQKLYLSTMSKMVKNGQLICTTHSPYIIDFRKEGQILKFSSTAVDHENKVNISTLNIEKDDYKLFGAMINEEITQMFFYDKVLLVEGASEKYFYNKLFNDSEQFRKYLNKEKMGIFTVYGIKFKRVMEIFKQLNIKTIVKTDNDIFTERKIFAGITRFFECLDDNDLKSLNMIMEIEVTKETFHYSSDEEKENIISLMSVITPIFKDKGIILQNHYDGFERDFLEFVDMYSEEEKNKLKKSKLNNLHEFICEHNITLDINEKNKHNVLVDFMNE